MPKNSASHLAPNIDQEPLGTTPVGTIVVLSQHALKFYVIARCDIPSEYSFPQIM
ncbi:MAG: hypothetical protein NUV74_11570 [Candidatus Brocadiaceae bacterium]|nr:hypothetical protein [Candidatus Brocadiaceae bacterium]